MTKLFLIGIIVGLGKILPGVSGAVLAMMLGVYELLIIQTLHTIQTLPKIQIRLMITVLMRMKVIPKKLKVLKKYKILLVNGKFILQSRMEKKLH